LLAAKKSRKRGSVVLFQGDSITDCGRNRERVGPNDPSAFGHGYPYLVASQLLAERPSHRFKMYNRGISGHRVPDLDARWQKDTVDLKPDLVSILIGVNDIWHMLNGDYKGTRKDYETGYAALLERTRKSLPFARIVVCEPFVLRCGAVDNKWFPEFDERRKAAKRVADAAAATWVGFQSLLDAATSVASPEYWAQDGVHPTMAGHAFLAKAWLETVKP
jgi:lysophospholipase L1-like esterase